MNDKMLSIEKAGCKNTFTDTMVIDPAVECPAQVYADVLKCPVIDLLAAISVAWNEERTTPIDNMVEGYVKADTETKMLCICNFHEKIFGFISVNVLFEKNENGQGICPCPECWAERRDKGLYIPAVLRRTLH